MLSNDEIKKIANLISKRILDTHPHHNARWLSLRQATLYCPYGKARLKRLVMEGRIKGGKHKDKKSEAWFFDRLSIDEYMESMCNPTAQQIEDEAHAIMRKAGLI